MSSGDELTRGPTNSNGWITDNGRYRAGILEGLRIAAEMANIERQRLEEEAACMHATFGIDTENAEAIEALRNIASAIDARRKEMGLAKEG